MIRVGVTLLVCLSACRFSVDSVTLSEGDASMPPDDGSVDDLARPPDLTSDDAMPDLTMAPDLRQVDMTCVPQVFPGFNSGATSPYDCRTCGCIIDDFTAFSADRWTFTAPSEWSTTMSGGVLTFATAGSSGSATAVLSSDTHFYLDGDFDVLVDYNVIDWPFDGAAHLVAIGSAGPPPTIRAATFQNGSPYLYIQIDSLTLQAGTPNQFGTFELRRTGSTACATVVSTTRCTTVGTGRLRLELQNTVQNGACAATCMNNCCTQHVEYRNLRLRTGLLVNSP